VVCGRGQFGIASGRKSKILKYFAGMVPMDRARQDWDYEHAETGWPLRSNDRNRSPEPAARLAACTRQGPCKPSENGERRSTHVEHPRERLRTYVSHGRLEHSATGYPQRYPQPAAGSVFMPRLAAHKAGSRAEAVRPWLSAHPLPCLLRARPSNLAACTGCFELPDGKVRWQKKFVFPARRMRRGLRF